MSEVALRPQGLDEALAERRHELRSPEVVMAPRQLGAARLTRYSFSRTLLRRAAREGWQARLVELDMDAEGRGHAIYRTEAGDRVFDFVAFTTTVDESLHTDRVIAEAWEVCGALVDGAVDGVGGLVRRLAGLLRRFHNGLVRTYAAGVALGAVALLLWFLTRASW